MKFEFCVLHPHGYVWDIYETAKKARGCATEYFYPKSWNDLYKEGWKIHKREKSKKNDNRS